MIQSKTRRWWMMIPEIGREDNTSWRANIDVAFYQPLQTVHNVDDSDVMEHRNATFYDGIFRGSDGLGLTPSSERLRGGFVKC